MVSTASSRTVHDRPDSEDEDWPSQAADAIERVVGSVRDKTTGPALTVAKAVVYGTFALIVGLAAFVLFIVAAVRFLDNYLPDAVFGDEHIWAAYLILGSLFVLVGVILWIRRRVPEQTPRY
jgi:hypothetical protein